jgi:C-terminal processing protease CtpA/Prc
MLQGRIVIEKNRKGHIGIVYNPSTQIIEHVHKDSNADKAGLRRGDVVIFCSDKDIAGPVGTEVTLVIRRNGRTILSFVIERQPIETISKTLVD